MPLLASFRQMLQQRGIAHLAREYPEGHSWGLWRAIIDEGLLFVFGDRP
jgi:enterochelin esterase-like enzyme